ncbi:MAG: class I SAM-dependent methyltransferase [Acidobacteria bacterium]|nr:class I SAM-dependent methyltransferase [Acidobacteriota bacterium]
MRPQQEERIVPLDEQALRLFADKGKEGGPGVPQAGDANAVKVRRVLQVTRDLSARPPEQLRVLDAGCGEGVYAIEIGLRRAHVVAFDARSERMSRGAECAERHGLSNVTFQLADIREVTAETHGSFDVVLLLGILYHLDVPDVFRVLENAHGMCGEILVVDTFVSAGGGELVEHRGERYEGQRVREHGDDDPPEVRRARLLRSIDNTFSFRFTRESLARLLGDVGFTSVFECLAPREPLKPADRVTLVALRGAPVQLSSYPWINGLSERQIEHYLRQTGP